MSYVRRTGDRSRYWVLESQCLGCECFAPGHYQTRGATLSGSRNTGDSKPCCPDEANRGLSPDLLKERKAEGWRKA